MRRLRLACGLSLLLAACGSASDGAASVRGRLFAGISPWDTSFQFVGPARIHGAGPFRIVVSDAEGSPSPGAANERVPRRSIEISLRDRPSGDGPILIGSPRGPTVVVESRSPGFTSWPAPLEAKVLLPDGSFVVRPVSGFLEVWLEGEEPGDGVSGRFVLELPTGLGGALERLEGSFAGALVD